MDSALAQWEEKENSIPDEEWAAVQQILYNTAKAYLGKPDRTHKELQTLMSRRDQAHQIELQTRSTRSTTAAYKRCVQTATKTHPCSEVRLFGKESSGAAVSC